MKIYPAGSRGKSDLFPIIPREPRVGYYDSNDEPQSYKLALRNVLPSYEAIWVHVQDERCSFETFMEIVEADALGLPIIITQGIIPETIEWQNIRSEYSTQIDVPTFVHAVDLPLIHRMIVSQLKGRVR